MRGVRLPAPAAQTRHRTGGGSLAEVILCTTILLIVILAVFDLFPSSLLTVRRAEHTLVASSLADRIVEQQRALPFSGLAATPSLAPLTASDGTVFTPSYSTFIVSGISSSRVVGFRVRVTWMEKRVSREVVRELLVGDVPK